MKIVKTIKKLLKRKILIAAIVIILISGGYFGYKYIFGNNAGVQYTSASVERGTLIVSVSGSGQVSVSDQVDIKPKTSGEIIYVGVKNGEAVKAGAILAKIDTRDAEKDVRDAETALETEKLELEELLNPADELALLQSENSLIQAKESKQKSEENLAKDYEDGFNTVVSSFFDLPSIMIDLEDILYGNSVNKSQDNIDAYADMIKNYEEETAQYKNVAAESYKLARESYDQNLYNYKNASRYSEENVIEDLANETYEDAKKISEAIKDADNFLSLIKDTLTQKKLSAPAILTTHQTTIKSDTTKINSILSELLSAKTAIRNDREAILSADRIIEEKELSFAKLKAGADELEIRAKKIAIQQKEDALITAKQNLNDCYIYSPFDGVVANIDVKKGDSVSSNSVATIITKQKIAEITLNEVNIAKVKNGQKANITFDAIEDLNISGQVAEVDILGTATQGVVTYGVKIVFDTQDERIKFGMSLSADIITNVRQDILIVPNSAIKSQRDIQYVQIMQDDGAVIFKQIEAGISNDTQTEIINGLDEGDRVITQAINETAAIEQTSSQSRGFMMMGAPR